VVVLSAGIVYGLAATGAAMLKRALGRKGIAHGADAAGGSVIGLVCWAVVVWLVAGFAQTSNILPLTQAASSSRIVQALDGVAPVPSTVALGALDDALGAAGFPEVFSGNETIHPIQAPDQNIPAAVQAKSDSVVKVLSNAPRCGTESTGSGWIAAPGRVVTNAHVVAGASAVAVQVRGTGSPLAGRIVAYDPERDLAVLDVPALNEAPLALGGTLGAGDSAVVAGYPGGGAYTLGGARVRQVVDATGKDIYQQQTVTREIYSLRATVRPGNSGGPLFDTSGSVVGVVFARSTTDGDTGYALTLTEVRPVLAAAQAGSTVSAGSCAVE
jgi:S1-C subfamily serine protease